MTLFRPARRRKTRIPADRFVPRSEFVGRDQNLRVVGTFGAANRGRRLSDDERRAIEQRMRSEGRL